MSMYFSKERPYTIQLSEMVYDPKFIIFDFDYEFYNPDHKIDFEKKFCDYFMFREIGQETIGRWKHQLRTTLNVIAPYYKQLYQTELASKDIQFMLNKDLKETFIREVEGENSGLVKSSDTSKNTGKNESQNIFNDTPRGSIEENKDYMTNFTLDNNKSEVEANTNSLGESQGKSKNVETTEFISQGNIGVTSSASLLQAWRDVLLNIDQLILDELEDLFFGLY